jgi:GR25 family glycosyltransferase involved in LPS biosynthesis
LIVYLITISGISRIDSKTRNWLNLSDVTLYQVGHDFRSKTKKELQEEYNLELLTFIIGGDFSGGEIGCLVSHQEVYKHMMRNKVASALIIEDDAQLNVEVSVLEKYIKECEESNFEIVHFSPGKGGILKKNDNLLAYAIELPLGAFSYWMTIDGARKLSRNNPILGLADWPLSIFRLIKGSTKEKLFIHADMGNSLIDKTRVSKSAYRENIVYRKNILRMRKSDIKFLSKLYRELGIWTMIKVFGLIKILRKAYFLRKFKRNINNDTVNL